MEEKTERTFKLRGDLIATMILKCGTNPLSLIERVEQGEKEVVYELGRLHIYREDGFIYAELDNPGISDKTVFYRWKLQ
ncbi:MAG: hypothetical protein AABY22_26685 [Nanoarchaeota archaeon]